MRGHYNKVRRVCLSCRHEFMGRSDAFYCSKKCYDSARRKNETPKIWPGICINCGANFFGKRGQKFCSHKCAHAGSGDGVVYSEIARENSRAEARRNAAKRARMVRLARRDLEAKAALGKDAGGAVRGRIPGGSAGAARTEFLRRWY